MAMLSRLFSDADGASGKDFDKAFRVRVDGTSSHSQEEWRFKGGTKYKAICTGHSLGIRTGIGIVVCAF